MNLLRLSRQSEESLARYHSQRSERFQRRLTPVLMLVALIGLRLLARQLGWP